MFINNNFSIFSEIKSAAEYYSSLTFTNNFIYVVEPCIVSWKINHLSKTVANTRYYTPLSSVIRNSRVCSLYFMLSYWCLKNI